MALALRAARSQAGSAHRLLVLTTRPCRARAVSKRGEASTAAAVTPRFRELGLTCVRSVETIRPPKDRYKVFQVMDINGKLDDSVSLPFSLEEGVRMYTTMVRSGVYDKFLLAMQRQGRISFYCTNFGEEATAVGVAAALQHQDTVWPQYRELGLFLYRGLTAQTMVDQCMANEGDLVMKGRNLPVHYVLHDDNVMPVHANLGTHAAQAPGMGYAYKLDKADRISVSYFGDGSASEGDALVGLNHAAVHRSQTLFVCRNNGYAISTDTAEQYVGDGVAARGPAFGMPTVRADGNDIVAVYLATKEARRIIIEEGTPVLLELMTYRIGDHTTSDDSTSYRKEDKAEQQIFKEQSPIPRWRTYLTSRGVWDDEKEAAFLKEALDDIKQAFKAGETKKRAPLRECFTDIYDEPTWNLEQQHQWMEQHVRKYPGDYNISKYRDLDGPAPAVDPRRLRSAPLRIPPVPTGPTEEMTMVSALNNAMSIAMAEDEKTVIFGLDVAFGGVFRCSMGLREKYGGDRVFNTPLSEQGIAGFAVGLSCAGYRALAEFQFADYIFPAFDQIINDMSKFRYRGGKDGCQNITMRAPCSAVGHGSMYHSQSVESYFAHCPGLKIVVPRGPRQAKGLLLAAIRDPNPVLFFEPKVLYRAVIKGPDGQVPLEDYELPLGQAEVVREGTDITLVGWGSQMGRLEQAADRAAKEGISCEIIDLQTIAPWDADTVEASVKKTGRLIVSHEAPVTGGFGGEITAKMQERCFLHLEAPIQRVCGWDTHFPLAWEEFYVPSVARVYDAIKETVNF